MTHFLDSIETAAENGVVELEGFIDSEYHAFLTAAQPLYLQLKAYAVTTGRTDIKQLLSDLGTALAAGIATTIASGGNVGAGIATVAATEIKQIGVEVTADAKNALYGGLAIVQASIPVPTPPAPPAA